jgi:hypothetical protein
MQDVVLSVIFIILLSEKRKRKERKAPQILHPINKQQNKVRKKKK